jgi:polyhydroxybutyrate depolymerase
VKFLTAVVVVLGLVLAAGCASNDDRTRSLPPQDASAPSTTTTSLVADPAYAPGRHVETYDVAGVQRTAIVVVPASAGPHPLVFVFHGHGGSGRYVERKVDIAHLWPDAVAVYPDGLPGHEGITDPAGRLPGWQTSVGELADRDLALYDTMLSTLHAKLSIDDDRTYVIGHSNGSQFASLLLNQRGDAIAAVANISAQPGPRLLAGTPPRSRFMVMGRQDPIVPYAGQKASVPLVELQLGVDAATATVDGFLRTASAPSGVQLAVYDHPGGHEIPTAVPPLIIQFFRRQTRPAG